MTVVPESSHSAAQRLSTDLNKLPVNTIGSLHSAEQWTGVFYGKDMLAYSSMLSSNKS